MTTAFIDLVVCATGHRPYDYQQRLADDGLPATLRIPTGTGKTMAAVLPWLYRRRHHPDPAVRKATPRRLVFVLPQRTLVEQTARVIGDWLGRLDETDVAQHVLMGGTDPLGRDWKTHPERDAIFVGTQDMIVSRLLMRGYAEPRAAWPMSFGLLHADTQFVFDEVQLMGPALPTSLQLHGLREEVFGAAAPCRSMWMSATLDVETMGEVAPDLRTPPVIVELSEADRAGPLRKRLDATRTVARIEPDPKRYAAELVERVLAEHTPGTRSLVVLNTVDRATEVYDALTKQRPAATLVLLHSRFRPADRAAHTEAATAEPPAAGRIVVSTQVLEAGVDISSELLVTEAAPWSSIVQRAGRCNRDGDAAHARLLWAAPPKPEPYEPEPLARCVELLGELEGEAVTSLRLQGISDGLPAPLHAVLRRRDLVDLFDTAPDLDGNDIDVSSWVRDGDDRTVSVAWRDLDETADDAPYPSRDELCPAPIGKPLTELAGKGRAQVYDQRDGGWRPAQRGDVRPGAVVLLDAAAGGYRADRGFDPRSTTPVDPLLPVAGRVPEAIATDPLSHTGSWVALDRHLADVEHQVTRLLDALAPAGVPEPLRAAARLAGRYHDLGKAHPVFATSLRKASPDEPDGAGPWAKSPGRGPLRHNPRYFRHELVSALLLLDAASGLLDGHPEPDLVTYLVAAHHGKVRLSVRGRPDERRDRVLGVDDGGTTSPAVLPDGTTVPARVLSLAPTRLGRDGLTARALRLRDRADLGVFRLAYLEAVVRAADWVASAGEETPDA